MGEAAYRKATDPNYGKPKPQRRGLVVSCPMEVDGTRFTVRSSSLAR